MRRLGDEEQRAVESGAEALGEEVEGVTGAGVARVVAGVAGVEAQPEDGDKGEDHDQERDGGERPRTRLNDQAPLAPPRLRGQRGWGRGRGGGRGASTESALAGPIPAHEPVAEAREDRREHGQRRHHHEQHGE